MQVDIVIGPRPIVSHYSNWAEAHIGVHDDTHRRPIVSHYSNWAEAHRGVMMTRTAGPLLVITVTGLRPIEEYMMTRPQAPC